MARLALATTVRQSRIVRYANGLKLLRGSSADGGKPRPYRRSCNNLNYSVLGGLNGAVSTVSKIRLVFTFMISLPRRQLIDQVSKSYYKMEYDDRHYYFLPESSFHNYLTLLTTKLSTI